MISRIFSHIEEGVLNALISAMTLLVFAEVIARFFFNTGFLWIQELTLTLCGWFVLFGMSYGVKVGAHIGVDAFVTKLNKKKRKITALIAVVICLIYCVMFLLGSWDYLAKMYQVGVPMEDIDLPHFLVSQLDPDNAWEYLRIDVEEPAVPLWMSQSILLIGFSLLSWRFIELAIAIIRNQTDGFKFADEAKESMHLIDQEADTSVTHKQGDK
ncbi:C4-dicarboxylate ABC transporter permease [Shewanella colwelliana]|uniref:TRAP transporter small permease protein n=1 Tax=Shewanella colwelliana TaxID=23 RepID=A0A1E5IVC2_SHECO|nr:TRAP transporter small permease [Shewanella colwelliana]MDX1283061.1 TRAP transporter small permease [Shewanella colwelliana]OEG74482.1 C4-dicarboxylate ABC transporter permease [Shewanella colwelliana]GIU32994.1 C4-dicarboxylate ABC transporter permease [Shewanella colwelliana]GIU46517.1 C4-dicarboxylate ABC transporter permease [Shewanella colwelliana]